MVRGLNSSVESELEWLREFVRGTPPIFARLAFRLMCMYLLPCGLDFRKRFLSLLSYKFREFGSVTALSILEAANVGIKGGEGDQSKGIISSRL